MPERQHINSRHVYSLQPNFVKKVAICISPISGLLPPRSRVCRDNDENDGRCGERITGRLLTRLRCFLARPVSESVPRFQSLIEQVSLVWWRAMSEVWMIR